MLKLKTLELQTELENVKKEKEKLSNQLMELESEKNEKIKTLQMVGIIHYRYLPYIGSTLLPYFINYHIVYFFFFLTFVLIIQQPRRL